MTYIFLGPASEQKRAKINEIKKKWLVSRNSQQFDYQVLYANKLDPKILKKTLLALPAVSKKCVILLHQFHKLTAQNKEIVFEFISSGQDHAVLILESDHVTLKDSFVKKLKPYCKMSEDSQEKDLNVFDITNAMERRNYSLALKNLSSILSGGQSPVFLMGGLVWFWGSRRNRLKRKAFEEGLLYLQEADLDIKRSRLKPDYAMERLIVKLCTLMG